MSDLIKITESAEMQIDLYQLFQALSEEDMEKLANYFAWHSVGWKEILRALREEYGSHNINSELYKLRTAFLCIPLDENDGYEFLDISEKDRNILRQMKDTVQNLLEDMVTAREEERRAYSAVVEIREMIKYYHREGDWVSLLEKSENVAREFEFERPYSFTLANQIPFGKMAANLDLLVSLWTETIQRNLQEVAAKMTEDDMKLSTLDENQEEE